MSNSTKIFPDESPDKLEESILPDTCIIPNEQTPLPKRSKHISTLYFPKESDEKKQTSAHEVKLGYKKGTNKAYFFKSVNPKTPNAEIEALLGKYGRLESPNYVPAMHTIHDDAGVIVGVASRANENFKPNCKVPLKESDMQIEILSEEIIKTRALLLDKLNEYTPTLERTPTRTSYSPTDIIGAFYSATKNTIIYRADKSKKTAVTVMPQLKDFLQDKNKFMPTKMKELLEILHSRLSNSKISAEEKTVLVPIIELATKLAGLRPATNIVFADVEKLDKLNIAVAAKGYVLEHLNNDDILPEAILDKNYQVSVRSLKHYRILAGLGNGLAVPYLGNNDDNHNGNFRKTGFMIDFDMYRFDITHQFKIQDDEYSLANIHDWLMRTPQSGQYAHTTSDIENFPDLEEFKPYFWPTIATASAKSGINSILAFSQNYFSSADNTNYKNLATVTTFTYHFFTRLLKAILRTESMHRSMGELEMRSDIFFNDKNDGRKVKNLFETLIQAENDCIKEVRHALVQSSVFKNFIASHGEYAFGIVQAEFEREKIRYGSKLAKKAYYKACYDAIDLEKIKDAYEGFKVEIGVKTSGLTLR